MRLSDEERKIIESFRNGYGIILNANFGFGVGTREEEDGRVSIFVRPTILEPAYDGPAIREFMNSIVASWQWQLSGGRLN